ncbi:MAG TPA: hypothetical protein PKZ97_05905 [Azospirillaceae bacterium]|nr:hypothetical protein [Azospirillaceae bacterium]
MKTRRSAAAVCIAAAICVAAAPAARAASVENVASVESAGEAALTAAETGVGWCVRGGVFAVLFSAAFSLPAAALGVGAPYTAARAGTAAVLGCGAAVTWRTFARGVAYVDGVVNPPPPVPPDPPPAAIPIRSRPALINTSG